jgi:hypothetical protein
LSHFKNIVNKFTATKLSGGGLCPYIGWGWIVCCPLRTRLKIPKKKLAKYHPVMIHPSKAAAQILEKECYCICTIVLTH